MTCWQGQLLPAVMLVLASLWSQCEGLHYPPVLQRLSWPDSRWRPTKSRRLLDPDLQGLPSSSSNSSDPSDARSGNDIGTAVNGTASIGTTVNGTTVSLKGSGANASSCPTINVYLRALQVIHPLVNKPGSEVLVRCQTNTGRLYKWYTIPIGAAYERSYSDAKFSLQLGVAQLKCGEAMSCRVGGQWPSDMGGAMESEILFDWGSSGCWFQYSHFSSVDQGSPLWSCRDPMVGEYVLQCAECSSGGMGSSSNGSGQGSGGRSSSINPTIIIIATCVCSATAIIVGLGLLVRHRRRTRTMDQRIVELLRRTEGGEGGARGARGGRPPANFKPPPLYRLEAEEQGAEEWGEGGSSGGGGDGEGSEGGSAGGGGVGVGGQALPPLKGNPPLPGYKGPIVVINYDGSSDLGEAMANGALVLAKPDLSGRDSHRHRHHSRSRRRRVVLLPPAPVDEVIGAEGTGALHYLPWEVALARSSRSAGVTAAAAGPGGDSTGREGGREGGAEGQAEVSAPAPPHLQSSLLAQIVGEREVERQRLRVARERERARQQEGTERAGSEVQPRGAEGPAQQAGEQREAEERVQRGQQAQHVVVVASEVDDCFEEVHL